MLLSCISQPYPILLSTCLSSPCPTPRRPGASPRHAAPPTAPRRPSSRLQSPASRHGTRTRTPQTPLRPSGSSAAARRVSCPPTACPGHRGCPTGAARYPTWRLPRRPGQTCSAPTASMPQPTADPCLACRRRRRPPRSPTPTQHPASAPPSSRPPPPDAPRLGPCQSLHSRSPTRHFLPSIP